MELASLQRTPIKLALAFLLLIEILIIAFFYNSPAFATYLAVLGILLCLPLSYFLYHYLRIAWRVGHPEVKVFQSIPKQQINSKELTNRAVQLLTESEEYKQFEKKEQNKLRRQKEGQDDQPEQGKAKQARNIEDIDAIMAELEEKEGQIFDHFD